MIHGKPFSDWLESIVASNASLTHEDAEKPIDRVSDSQAPTDAATTFAEVDARLVDPELFGRYTLHDLRLDVEQVSFDEAMGVGPPQNDR